MIDVPVEVKDALRDGRLKKNYRIKVLSDDAPIEIKNYESAYAPKTGTYRFYSPVAGFSFGIMIGIDQGGYWDADPTETEIIREFDITAGTRILAYSSAFARGDVLFQMSLNVITFTLDNNNLVSESVNIDERLCSDNKIKFGLCEGSSIEFQYFGYPAITDRRIQVFCDVEYKEGELYTIPMGFFEISRCSRQASTGIIKATGYNKLQSNYLDAKANDLLLETFDDPTESVPLFDIRRALLEDYGIEEVQYQKSPVSHRWEYEEFMLPRTMKIPKYGAVSHINYYHMDRTTTTIYPSVLTSISRASLSPDKAYKLSTEYPARDYEQAWYKSIYDTIDAAHLTDLSASEYMPYIINKSGNYKGWVSVFSVELVKNNQSEYYTDIGYENNVQGVTGTLTELCNKTIIGYDEIIFRVASNILLYRNNSLANYENDACILNSSDIYYYVDDPTGVPEEQLPYYIRRIPNNPYQVKLPDGTLATTTTARYLPFITLSEITNISEADKIIFEIDEMPEFTLRDITSAAYETLCQFGKLDRVTDLFSGVELNHSRLYPLETLYPDNAFYPEGAQSSATKSMYSKLWADEGNVHKWKNLIITYKGLDENQQEKDFTVQYIVNGGGTDDYECTNNWLFKNLIWTEEQIDEYAEAMVEKMRDMTWFPFEMWCAGLPYLETGDEIEIPMGENSYTSYVLQRQLKGIQNLQDTYINGNLDIF